MIPRFDEHNYLQLRRAEACLRSAAQARGYSTVAICETPPSGSESQELAAIQLYLCVPKWLTSGYENVIHVMARCLVLSAKERAHDDN